MTDIVQAVAAYNEQRAELATTRGKAYGKQNWIMALLAIALVAIAFFLFRNGSVGGAVGVLFVGAIILGIVFTILRGSADGPGIALQRTIREQVFPALFEDVVELNFQADTKGFYDEIPDALKPAGDRAGWGDLIEGSYKGQPIAINEVSISRVTERNDKTETVQVFKGIAIRTGLAEPVPEIILSKNRLAVAKWISDKLGTRADTPHIAFDDAAFEQEVDVHSSNEGFARAVFSDRGRARYRALKEEHTGGLLTFAAMERNAWIMVENEHDFFELPPLDRPFDLVKDGHKLQGEMRGFLDLIDGVRDILGAGVTEQFRL